ncbi:MAG: hypothetical protein KC433_03575 [Anaerolineales bacterium]|nr:hypothetical protein [Anaerolineales bacterium]MCB8937012.1 hypothetical protein [Ardenticatenaceae bacterium]
MGEGILVTPLGLSPGAVSGMALALNAQLGRETISRVEAIGTTNKTSLEVGQKLKELLNEKDILFKPHFISQAELDTDDAATEFMLRMGQLLGSLQGQGHKIHVGVTSGRSGMGALAALATNVYGADHLWHLWVSKDIEEKGRWEILPRPHSLDTNKYLNPTLEDGAYQVVKLPFLDLRPYHPILRQYYLSYKRAIANHQTPDVPKEVSPLLTLLVNSQIERFEELFPAELSFGAAQEIADMVAKFSSQSPEEQDEAMIRLGAILRQHQIIDEQTRQRLQRVLRHEGDGEEVWRILTSDTDTQGIWQRIAANKDQLSLGVSATALLLQIAMMILQIQGVI